MRETDIITDPDKIDSILDRGVIVNILPSREEFRSRLLSGTPIRIYVGADPTSTKLHLSHAKNYMLLEEFRKLGHEVIVLFGTFTARIGDPSDRNSVRDRLSSEDIAQNVEDWLRQIRPLLGFDDKENPPLIRYNHEWLSTLSFEDVINLASHFTVQQMLERDMFDKRIKEGKPVHLHEFLYPLMQGYDSVAMNVDAEMGGTDQTFNMLAGRILTERINHKDKFVIAVNLMEDPKTGALMSKSAGNGVFLDSGPNDMYGAIMAQSDEMTKILFVNCTRVPLKEIDTILALGPKEAKMRVAREIVAIFHGGEAAKAAEENFIETFSKGGIPADVETVKAAAGDKLVDILLAHNTVESKSEWRRLVEDGAVRNAETDEKITSPDAVLEAPITLKVGKRRFIKIDTV